MKVRVIAGVVLLPLLLLLVLFAPKVCTAILFGLMSAIGAYELLRGTGLVKELRLNIYSMVMALWTCLWCGLGISHGWLLLAGLLFWVLLFAEMMLSGMKLPFQKIGLCLVAGIVLPLLLGSLVRIHADNFGKFHIFIPFILAFLSDTGAYFAGYFFGKHKLAPVISPKKTIGAMLGMVIYCLVIQLCFKQLQVHYLFALIYGLLGSLAAVFGDLCFSVIKRQTGIKDYGNLIPGHGGILDRFDSMMLVGPLAEVMILLIPVVEVRW